MDESQGTSLGPKFRHEISAEMHGWVFKKTDRMFAPKKKRYFILEAQELSCHHQPNVSPSWEVSVQDAKINGDEAQLRISIECDTRSTQIIAFSHEEYVKWLTALQRASSRAIEDFYEMGKLIGEGGFAKVLLGADKETREPFAVKCISKQNSDDEEMDFLSRELNIMKRVNHPNVIRTFDIFDSKKHLYIVLEYMEAGTLHEVFQKSRPFTEQQARSAVYDVISGVDYLHGRNIVHRDLKLKNILCKQETFPLHCKLADFGLSNFVGVRTMSKVILQSQVGSPHYVAPEVLSGGLYGPSVDIWSVGVIAHVLLTGKYPFAGKTMQETLERVAKGHVMFKDAVWKDINLDAFSFVKDCLKDNPNERLTAEKALSHSWLRPDNPLEESPAVE